MFIINTAEVWALLIPLAVWYRKPAQPRWMFPIITYLILAFCTNLVADLISELRDMTPKEERKHFNFNNLFLYNIHCVIRFVTLLTTTWFLQVLPTKWFRVIVSVFAVAMLAHPFLGLPLIFPGPGDLMNANLMTLEAFLLLIPCMGFYLKLINSDTLSYTNRKDFWAITSITIYFVINFFLFLFYTQLFVENARLAAAMWTVHNIAFIVFCIFIAIALYVPDRDYD